MEVNINHANLNLYLEHNIRLDLHGFYLHSEIMYVL